METTHTNANETTSYLLLTKQEVADNLQLCVRSVENAVKRKALAVVRLGTRCVRFRPEDVRRYIESRRFKAVGE